MSRIHGIERRIDELLRGLLRSPSPEQRRELIEVHRAILDEVASRVVTLPRGKLAFDYSQIRIEIYAEPEQRPSYERVFLKGAALEHQITSSFQESNVEYPDRLKVEVELVGDLPPEAKARGFHIFYSNLSAMPAPAEPRQIRLTVLAGAAEQTEYRFQRQRVNIGRLPEVLDAQLRPIRRNDVALKDGATGVNATVSRTHAHIEWDTEAARFRLFDDGSTHGTTLLREGSLIPVPKGASKGVLLQAHDQIIVGQAHIRFEYLDSESQPA